MIYIIEGPDGAGKTTLAKQIKEASPGSQILHFGAPETDEDAERYWQIYFQALKEHAGETIILDRSWYSDMVYGPIMRNRLEMTPQHKEMLELTVRALGGGIVIYCTGSQQRLWARCRARGETYIPDSNVHKEICKAYDRVMKTVQWLPVVCYDTTVKR